MLSLRGVHRLGRENSGEEAAWSPSTPSSLCLQTVFLLWNSLNDPLFGWLSDRQFLSSQPRFVSWGWLITGPIPTPRFPRAEDPLPVFGVGKERDIIFSCCPGFLLPEVRADCPGGRSGLD